MTSSEQLFRLRLGLTHAWLALGFLSAVVAVPGGAVETAAAPRDCVVLLHGIGMRGIVMTRLASALEDDGYRVVNLTYPSRQLSLDQLVRDYLPAELVKAEAASAPHLHFVTHSMGSIVLRQFIRDRRPANLGRVVMIGPPNHGSTFADWADRNKLLHRFMGENLVKLGTGAEAITRTLPPADFEVGIIAGDNTINPWSGKVLTGPNDGAVTVESARLEGMRDFLVVPYSHTMMLWRSEVITQARTFLREGKFRR